MQTCRKFEIDFRWLKEKMGYVGVIDVSVTILAVAAVAFHTGNTSLVG